MTANQGVVRRSVDGVLACCFIREERIALFIDGANLYAAARALAFDIDYKRLLELFGAKGRLIRAFYYTALIEDQEYSPLRPLVDWLDYNGYTMVTKPTKEFTDAMGRRKIKGNMDIELAIDVMEMAQSSRPHRAVLGRRRFPPPGRGGAAQGRARHRGLDHPLQPPMVADELRRQADVFIELQDLAPQIMRAHGNNHQREQQQYSDSDA